MKKQHLGSLLLAITFFASLILPAYAAGPQITLFYGNDLQFGELGQPQRFVNVLGNVSPAEAGTTLTYALNGGAERPLTLGPTLYRLAADGDFNIDIPTADLRAGENEIVVTATSPAGEATSETITVDYSSDAQWPLPYSIDWAEVNDLTDVVQVVDGEWEMTAEGIRPLTLGYDRLIAVGDMSWTDYEVTVPITIHGAEPRFGDPSYGASVGVAFRWNGHSERDVTQPANGWWPLGSFGQILWVTPRKQAYRLSGNKLETLGETPQNFEIEFGETYIMKMRVESLPDNSSFYSMKVWEENMAEPEQWQFTGHQHAWDPLGGSFLLVAHHVDATFGNINVTPLAQSTSWQLLIDYVPYLAQVPLFLVCLLGLFFIFRQRQKQPAMSKFGLPAMSLLLLYLIVSPLLTYVVPPQMHGMGLGTNEIGLTLLAGQVLLGVLLAAGLGLLLLAVARWQRGS